MMTVFSRWRPTYLVKSRKDVVRKLDLSNGCGPSNSYTNTKSHNPLLTKGSVEDSVFTWGDSRSEVLRGCWVREPTFTNFQRKKSPCTDLKCGSHYVGRDHWTACCIYLFGTTKSGGWTQQGLCHTLEWWDCKKYSLKMPCSPKINEATSWLLLLSCSYPNLWCTHNPHGVKTKEKRKKKTFFTLHPIILKRAARVGL